MRVNPMSSTTRRRYVALLRAISNVRMGPFRDALRELGFIDVESYGTSGNLMFTTDHLDTAVLERRIGARLDVTVLVRTRSELARVVAEDPFGSSVLFLSRPPTAARRRAFAELDFEPPRPFLRGRTAFFVYPVRLRGKRSPLDLERALGVAGTARSARVVTKLADRMRA
jgi:uncharacterized protein (DUF1697 family)